MVDVGKRQLALMGVGLEGHKLFWRYREEGIKIQYVVDNVSRDNFWGMKIVRPEDIIQENPYFLISSDKYYKEMKNQLESYGLREFDDFCKGKALNRKVVLINANCYATLYADFLNSNSEFRQKYYIYDSVPRMNVSNGKWEKNILRNCDICLTQGIDDTERNHFFSKDYIISNINDNADVIVIPNLVGMGRAFFPFAATGNIRNENSVITYGFFPYREVLIDQYVEEGITEMDIVSNLILGKGMSSKYISNNFNKIISDFMEKEKQWDIRIVGDIVSIYHEEKVFYDLYHPTNAVFEKICKKILRAIGIEAEQISSEYNLGGYEMPIYPMVAHTMKLNWWRENMEIRNESQFKFGNFMDTATYVKEYIDWCYKRNIGKSTETVADGDC